VGFPHHVVLKVLKTTRSRHRTVAVPKRLSDDGWQRRNVFVQEHGAKRK
jgi:hypothetical protein